ncbi:hypothetical protein GCM10027597_16820 [Saccharopolyspora tripterygii]
MAAGGLLVPQTLETGGSVPGRGGGFAPNRRSTRAAHPPAAPPACGFGAGRFTPGPTGTES